MYKLTPSEARKRQKLIEDFDKCWYVNAETSEIRHQELNLYQKALGLFWRKKYKVSDMYCWSTWKWYGWDMMSYPDSIKHDDIPIQGFPRKYQLINDWSIPQEDLKYLYDGPLINENGDILIHHQSILQKLVSFLTQLKPLTWIIGFLFLCIRYWEEVRVILDYIKENI